MTADGACTGLPRTSARRASPACGQTCDDALGRRALALELTS